MGEKELSDARLIVSGGSASYRERAKEMLQRAEGATTEEAEIAFKNLAECWSLLAKRVEEKW